MVKDVYKTASGCSVWVRNRAVAKAKIQLQMLSVSSLHEFIAFDTFEPLPRTANGSRYAVVMTDSYFKLLQALPTGKTSFEKWQLIPFARW